MFEYFGMRDSNGTRRDVAANRSPVPTAQVVAELEKDEEFMKMIRRLSRWEYKIYKFALQMHMRQYESVQAKSQTPCRSVK